MFLGGRMAKMRKIEFNIAINNIGPHKNFNATYQVDSLKLGIFAENGRGKTFISSLFDFFKPEDSPFYSIPKELIALGEKKGEFLFSVKNNDTSNKKSFKLTLDSDKGVNISKDGDYIFHVFNEYFIKNNIREYDTSTLEIPGEILLIGKEKIDLKEEKEKLEKASILINTKENFLKEEISKLQVRLKNLKVNAGLAEYSTVNYENLLTAANDSIEDFESVKNSYEKSSNMPETTDILEISFPLTTTFIEDIETLLKTPYQRSTISENVKKKISGNSAFYEKGLEILGIDKKDCPFCTQNLTDTAFKVIDIYESYFKDEEASILKKLDILSNTIIKCKTELTLLQKNYLNAKVSFDKIKEFLPSYANITFQQLAYIDTIEKSLEQAEVQIAEKKKDITKDEYKNLDVSIVKNNLSSLENIIKSCNKQIISINNAKSKIQNEIRELRRQLCVSGLNNLKKSNKEHIGELRALLLEKKALEEAIASKENNEKIIKKDKIYEDFANLVSNFFPNKYSFNTTTGEITFQNSSIKNKVHYFFSEGERRVLALCFYFAMTHSLIKQESEYQNLFFVIDDPISSLDFKYNYAVCTILQDIKKRLFPKIGNVRIIIFTHSLEFMSTLIRNQIINDQFFISKDGQLKIMGQKSLLPYYSHLQDIIEVATMPDGIECKGIHTLPNSIRHVLETICKFVSHRNKNLDDFIKEDEILRSNIYLQKMIQDLSHGNWRQESPIADEHIKETCRVVCKYIESKFKGQIDSISIP